MNPQSVANHLAECLRAEVESKRAALSWIEAQEQALAARDAVAFERAVTEVGELVSGDRFRATRRKELLARLAAEWRVPPQALTLGGVARRLGGGGAPLEELRLELRGVLAELMKRTRRLATLIGLHRRINTDVMQLMLGCSTKEEVDQGGSLVNAEA
jgi:hypothetical protein